ncbi:MAG: DJ-1/PfpI family protein [Candidatus Gracilibacteria bacterium]
MTKIIMILAPERYQEQEYGDPRRVFEEEGFTVKTASTVKVAQGKLGGKTTVDLLLQDVQVNDFDAIVFVGGPGAFVYFEDEVALNLARAFEKEGKFVTAICAGPGILANAGVLKGKRATCWSGEGDHLKEKGATYTGALVEQDGKTITADGPLSAEAFGQTIVAAMKEGK